MSNLPYLKNNDKLGSGVAQVGPVSMLESVGGELMDAISRKDIKLLRQALESIVRMLEEENE